MQVKEVLKAKQKEVITITTLTGLREAMEQLISNRISCLPVIDADNHLVGIVSDKDIFKTIYERRDDFEHIPVADIMSTELIVGISDDNIEYISGLMTNNRIRHIPIVDEETLIGLISIGDIVKAKQEHIEIENRYLKQYIDGSYPG